MFTSLFHQGVDEGPDGLKLISDVIQEKLGITMSVLMGANIANEVADEKFCETTIGETWFFFPKVLKHSLGVLHPLRFLNPYSGSFSPDSAEQCNAVPLGGSINKSLIVLIE